MKPIHILLVEDNEGDILLTSEALEEAKIVSKISIARDGKEAVDFLTRQGKYTGAELPDLVLLDVNLPKKNGHEVLKYLKGNEDLKHIPVIMLTTSSSAKDIDLALNNYADCYITKPVEVNEFIGLVDTIKSFVTSAVELSSKKVIRK